MALISFFYFNLVFNISWLICDISNYGIIEHLCVERKIVDGCKDKTMKIAQQQNRSLKLTGDFLHCFEQIDQFPYHLYFNILIAFLRLVFVFLQQMRSNRFFEVRPVWKEFLQITGVLDLNLNLYFMKWILVFLLCWLLTWLMTFLTCGSCFIETIVAIFIVIFAEELTQTFWTNLLVYRVFNFT